jgi:hypothetical protein
MELADGTLEDWQSISQSFLVPSAGLVHAVNGWMDGWMDGWVGGFVFREQCTQLLISMTCAGML